MRTYSKYLISAALASMVLAALVGSASATRLRVSTQQIRAVWTPLTFQATGATIRCNVTLEGTLHESTFLKSVTLLGYVTRVGVTRPCTGGTAWAYNGSEVNEALRNTVLGTSLPWHISYEGFSGSLPEPTSVNLLLTLARFLLRATVFGITILCAYRSEARNNLRGRLLIETRGRVTGLRADESASLPSESGGACPAGVFIGTGVVTVLGTANAISVTLI
jgi:hypothetical protein